MCASVRPKHCVVVVDVPNMITDSPILNDIGHGVIVQPCVQNGVCSGIELRISNTKAECGMAVLTKQADSEIFSRLKI